MKQVKAVPGTEESLNKYLLLSFQERYSYSYRLVIVRKNEKEKTTV